MWPNEMIAELEKSPVIAVVIVDEPRDAVETAKALVRGGVSHMELTLRTDNALKALEMVIREVPEMRVGAGTVLTPVQVRQVKRLGAAFAVSPGLNTDVVAAARDAELPFAPGIATPTDIETAVSAGCTTLKLFPAVPLGGVKYLQTVNAAYRHLGLRYIPLGGLSAASIQEWLDLPEVLAIGGSWVASRDLIEDHRWDDIERRARDAAQHNRR